MAKRNSTSKTRPGRGSPPARPLTAAPQHTPVKGSSIRRRPLPLKDPLSIALEAERIRLEQVHNILGCLAHSLTYNRETETQPGYSPAEVTEVARSLVSETLNRLDPLRLVQLMAASKLTFHKLREVRVV